MNLIQEIERARIQPLELFRVLDEPRVLSQSIHRDRAAIAEAEYVAGQLGEKFAKDLWRRLELERVVKGAGGLTQSYSELYYSNGAVVPTELNTFTTEDNLQKTLPHIIIPAGFFNSPNNGIGRSFRCEWWGRINTTGTPTFTINARLLTSTTWSAGGVGIATAAITAGSGITYGPFRVELRIAGRTIGAGGGSNTTLFMGGHVIAGTAFAAGGGVYSMPDANTAFTKTLDSSATQYLYLSAACGTNNASNKIAVEQIAIHAEN